MKFKITARDVKVFLLGFFTMFIIVIIYDWNDFVDGFKAGYNDSQKTETIK